MFGFLKSSLELIAPVSGRVLTLSSVPDEVFATKLAGDGVAIEPSEDIFVAPADGELVLIFKTNHAFCIRLENGIEILVHIGIDTVNLNGEFFERLAVEGTRVKAGDPIVKVNRDKVLEKGYSLISPILITNMEIVKEINCFDGKVVKARKDAIISYKIK
ncbi:MAG: PTS glucose transporter subunit IIA [Clostridiaceae bacterium]|nr:PTS glucose transporter subunit IIA [Clostridiaceae bacterium]